MWVDNLKKKVIMMKTQTKKKILVKSKDSGIILMDANSFEIFDDFILITDEGIMVATFKADSIDYVRIVEEKNDTTYSNVPLEKLIKELNQDIKMWEKKREDDFQFPVNEAKIEGIVTALKGMEIKLRRVVEV